MSMSKDELFAAALALPEADRIRLASRLHEHMRSALGQDPEYDLKYAIRGAELAEERERLGIQWP